jgi:hypothetical protein
MIKVMIHVQRWHIVCLYLFFGRWVVLDWLRLNFFGYFFVLGLDRVVSPETLSS